MHFSAYNLLCELVMFEMKNDVNRYDRNLPERVYMENHLALWEIEEIECVYNHLYEKYRGCDPGMIELVSQHRPSIVQRLFFDIEDLGEEDSWFLDPLGEMQRRLNEGFYWARQPYNLSPEVTTKWSNMPGANCPNEGWIWYVRNGDTWNDLGLIFSPYDSTR